MAERLIRRVYELPADLVDRIQTHAIAARCSEVVAARKLLERALADGETGNELELRATAMRESCDFRAVLEMLVLHPLVARITTEDAAGARIACSDGHVFFLLRGEVMAERARLWEVATDRGGGCTTTSLYSATTRSKAMAEAWRTAHDAWDVPFGDFVKATRVRATDGPVPDAYAYVRRTYGVDVRIGERVSVRGERDGEVVYPGASTTAHVHVLFDEIEFAMPVHPRDIVQHAKTPTAPAPALEPADAGEIPF